MYSSSTLYTETNILPLNLYIEISNEILVYGIKNNCIHHNIELRTVNSHHQYDTRKCSDLARVAPKSTKYGLNNILYKAITVFNNLPNELKIIKTYQRFKREIKNYYSRMHDVKQVSM